MVPTLKVERQEVLTSPSYANVLKTREDCDTGGMLGGVEPESETWARVTIGDFPINLCTVSLWDAHPLAPAPPPYELFISCGTLEVHG